MQLACKNLLLYYPSHHSRLGWWNPAIRLNSFVVPTLIWARSIKQHRQAIVNMRYRLRPQPRLEQYHDLFQVWTIDPKVKFCRLLETCRLVLIFWNWFIPLIKHSHSHSSNTNMLSEDMNGQRFFPEVSTEQKSLLKSKLRLIWTCAHILKGPTWCCNDCFHASTCSLWLRYKYSWQNCLRIVELHQCSSNTHRISWNLNIWLWRICCCRR